MSKNEEIIHEALENYDSAETSMREIIADAKDDINFVSGNQWDEQEIKDRKGRPCLTINKLNTIINQVANDQRQNRPSVKARPVDSNVDKDTAKIINGMLRHIQYQSESEIAFDTACDQAITSGIGFVRVCTDYVDDDRFEQEIRIDRIENALNVRFPIHLCRKSDWSDAPYAFITYEMSRKEFERRYPDENITDWSIKTGYSNWVTDDTVTLCEYFKVESKKITIYAMPGGGVAENVPEGIASLNSREVEKKTVRWRLITAASVLDENEIPVSHIPIVPMLGKEMIVDGKKKYISLVRFAKDAQRMLNYWKSLETELIANAPRAPYIGAKGQFEGFQKHWASANTKNTPYLEYNPISIGGQLIGRPDRTAPPAIPSGIVNAIMEAKEDIKETTGIFDASIGAKSNETSGRAIIARQREGDTGTFHFIDNLTRSMRHVFRIIVELIPKIYDSARTIRILGEDMEDSAIVINSPYIDPDTQEQKYYSMGTDKYDIVVDVGASFATKRLEAAESVNAFMQTLPNQAPMFADIAARNFDWHGSEEIAQRLKDDLKARMPHLFQGEKNKQDQGNTQELEAGIQQMEKVIDELQGVIEKMSAELENKDADRKVEIEKELIKSRTEIEKAHIQTKPKMLDSVANTVQQINNESGYDVSGRPVPVQYTEQPLMRETYE